MKGWNEKWGGAKRIDEVVHSLEAKTCRLGQSLNGGESSVDATLHAIERLTCTVEDQIA